MSPGLKKDVTWPEKNKTQDTNSMNILGALFGPFLGTFCKEIHVGFDACLKGTAARTEPWSRSWRERDAAKISFQGIGRTP